MGGSSCGGGVRVLVDVLLSVRGSCFHNKRLVWMDGSILVIINLELK